MVVAIRDTGSGISGKDMPHLFERFFRTEGIKDTDGFGLGLAIVKTIIDAHGGSIAAESEKGKGSTFTVRLPYRREGTSGEAAVAGRDI
jgi:two-component system sensor histidine kinase BaeS